MAALPIEEVEQILPAVKPWKALGNNGLPQCGEWYSRIQDRYRLLNSSHPLIISRGSLLRRGDPLVRAYIRGIVRDYISTEVQRVAKPLYLTPLCYSCT
jgi:hypothetical protein